MCFKREENEPVRLNKKQDGRKIIITPEMLVLLMFIICFVLAIIFAWIGKGAYYYNMGGLA